MAFDINKLKARQKESFGFDRESDFSLEDFLPSQTRPELSTAQDKADQSIVKKADEIKPDRPASKTWDNLMLDVSAGSDIGMFEFGWEALKRAPKVFVSMAETTARVIRRGDEDINVDSALDRFIDGARDLNQNWQKLDEADKARKLFKVPFTDIKVTLGDLDNMLSNMGYSVMGFIAQKISGQIGGKAGSALMAWGSPAAQAAGGGVGKFTGEAAGGLAFLTSAAYDQFIDQHKEHYMRNNMGASEEEMQAGWAKTYETIKGDARLYAFYEAAPEVASNMMMWGIAKAGKAGLSKKALDKMMTKLAKGAGAKIALKLGIPVAKLIAMLGEELATETVTQKLQASLEKKTGLREDEIDWKEAFKEVFPQTFLQTLAMGGGVMIGQKMFGKKKKDKPKKDDGPKTHEERRLDEIRKKMEGETDVKTKEELEEDERTEHEKRKEKKKQEESEAAKTVNDGKIEVEAHEAEVLKKYGQWNDKLMAVKPAKDTSAQKKQAAIEEAKAKATVNRMTAQEMQDKINREWEAEQKPAFEPESEVTGDLLPVPVSAVRTITEAVEREKQLLLEAPQTEFKTLQEMQTTIESVSGKQKAKKGESQGYKNKATAERKAKKANLENTDQVSYVVEVTKGNNKGFYIASTPVQKKQEGPAKIVPESQGEVVYLDANVVEQTGDRKREELEDNRIDTSVMDDEQVEATYNMFKAQQGEFSRLTEDLTDAEKFDILAEDVALPEMLNPEENMAKIASMKQTDATAIPARITFDGTVMPDPGASNPKNAWEPKNFSKLKQSDISKLHRAWNRAASHLRKILPHSDGINGFIIDGEFFSDRFVLQAQKFFTKAAAKQTQREQQELDAQQAQASVEQAQQRARQAARDKQGRNQKIEEAWDKMATNANIFAAIRVFRRKSAFADLFATGWKDKDTGRVMPDELFPIALDAGLNILSDAVRNDKQAVLEKKNAFIGALINKLNDAVRTEIRQQTGMTEHEMRKALEEGTLRLPKTGRGKLRVHEEMDVIENAADLEEGVQLGEVPKETGIDVERERTMRSIRAHLKSAKKKNPAIGKYLQEKFGDDKLGEHVPDATLLEMAMKFMPRAKLERILTQTPVDELHGKVKHISEYQLKKGRRQAERQSEMMADLAGDPKIPGPVLRDMMSSYIDPIYLTILSGRTFQGMNEKSTAKDGEMYQMRVVKSGLLDGAIFESRKEATEAAAELNDEFTKQGDGQRSYIPVRVGTKWWIRKDTYDVAPITVTDVQKKKIKELQRIDPDEIKQPTLPVWHATMSAKEYQFRTDQYYAMLNVLAQHKIAGWDTQIPANLNRIFKSMESTWMMDPNYYAYSWQVERSDPTVNRKPTLTTKGPNGKRQHTVNYWQRFLKLKLPKKQFAITGEAALAARGIMTNGNTNIEAIISPELEKSLNEFPSSRLVRKNFGLGGYRFESPDGVIKLIPTRFMKIHKKFGDIKKTGSHTKTFLFEDLDTVKSRYADKNQQDMVDLIDEGMNGKPIDPSTDVEYLEMAVAGPRAERGGPSAKLIKPQIPTVKRTRGDEITGFKEELQHGQPGLVELEMAKIRTVGIEQYRDELNNNIAQSGLSELEREAQNKFVDDMNKLWADYRHAKNHMEETGKKESELSPHQQRVMERARQIQKQHREDKRRRDAELAKDRITPKYVAPPPVDKVTEAVVETRARKLYADNKRRKVKAPLSRQAQARMDTMKEGARPVKEKKGKPVTNIDEWENGDYIIKFKNGASVGGIDPGNAWENAPSKYRTLISKGHSKLYKIVDGKLERVKTPDSLMIDPTEAQDAIESASDGTIAPADPVQAVTKPVEPEPQIVDEATEVVAEPTKAEEKVDEDPGIEWALHNGKWIRIPEPDADFDQLFFSELQEENAHRPVPGLMDKLFDLEERAGELEESELEEEYSDTKNYGGTAAYNAINNESGLAADILHPMNWPYYGVKGVKAIAKAFTPTAGRFANTMKKFTEALDVELAFQRIKRGGESGFHVKNIFSHREALFDRFENNVIGQFNRLVEKHLPGAKPEHLADIVFAAENATVRGKDGKQEKYETVLRRVAGEDMFLKNYAPLINFMRSFFKKTRKDYGKRGVNVDWIQRKYSELMQKWEATDRTMDQKELDDMKKAMTLLGQLQGMHFIHIPASMWVAERINDIVAGTPGTPQFKKKLAKLKDNIKKQRHAMSIAGMVKHGVIKREAVNPFEILMHYGYRQAEDFSYYNVRDAFKKDGFLLERKSEPKKPEGVAWQKVPKHLAALMGKKADKHTWIRTDVLDALNAATANVEPKSFIGKGMSMYKMLRFYNPLFLPAYDVVQSIAFAGAINPFVGVPAAIKAVNSMRNQDADYFDAASNGLFSTPFQVPFSQVLTKARMLAKSRGVTGMRGTAGVYLEQALQDIKDSFTTGKYFKGLGQMGTAPVLATMHASWAVAWKLDNFVRMYTYHYLRSKKHNPKEAAQFAALVHGDYAGVPARTRRAMNNVFFTPTFKIAMAKTQMNMLNSTWKLIKGDIVKQTDKARIAKRAAFGGLAMTAMMMGFDMLMKSYGYEDEEWGRRYTKTVMTDEGPKEIVFNWSNPANLYVKYMYRIMNLIDPPPAEAHPSKKFVEEFLYEFHPLYQTLYRFWGNRRFDGKPIWNEFDSGPKKAADVLKWVFADEIFPMVNVVNGWFNKKKKTKSIRQAERAVAKDFGVLMEFATSPFVFKYSRSTPDKRFQINMQQMNRRFKVAMKNELRDNGKIRPEWIKNYYKKYMELIKKWAEEKKK